MIYLVECVDDNSYCFVEDCEILNDAEEVTENGCIEFFYNSKKIQGIVLKGSESEKELKQYFKKYQALERKKKIDAENEKANEKRQRGKKRSLSSSEESVSPPVERKKKVIKSDTKKPKKPGKKNPISETTRSQNLVSKAIEKNDKKLKEMEVNNVISDTSEEESSPVSERLKQKKSDEYITSLKNLNQKSLHDDSELLKAHSSQSNTPKSSKQSGASSQLNFEKKASGASSQLNFEKKESFASNKRFWCKDDDLDDIDWSNDKLKLKKSESLPSMNQIQPPQLPVRPIHLLPSENSDQLYGKDYDKDKMIHLKNNIYCRKKIYDSTISVATAVTNVLRRLIEDIFRVEKLTDCTATGQSPRGQGKEKSSQEFNCLDPVARKAIIDFATEQGRMNNWEIPSIEKMKRTITQKVGELKKQHDRDVQGKKKD